MSSEHQQNGLQPVTHKASQEHTGPNGIQQPAVNPLTNAAPDPGGDNRSPKPFVLQKADSLKVEVAMPAPYKHQPQGQAAVVTQNKATSSGPVVQRTVVARVDFADPATAAVPNDPPIAAVFFSGRPTIPYQDGNGSGQGDHTVANIVFEHAVQNALENQTFTDGIRRLNTITGEIRTLPGYSIGHANDVNARDQAITGLETTMNNILSGNTVVPDIRKTSVLASLAEGYLNARSSLRLVSRSSSIQNANAQAPSPSQNQLGAANLKTFQASNPPNLSAQEIATITSAMWATFDYRPTNLSNGRKPEDAANAVATLVISTFHSYPNLDNDWVWDVVGEVITDFIGNEGASWNWSGTDNRTFTADLSLLVSNAF